MKLALGPVAYCRGKGEIKLVGGEWVLDETCENPIGSKVVRKTTISGDSQSTIAVRVEDEGAKGGVAPIQTLTARWISAACADGFKPSDVALAYTGKVNAHRPSLRLPQDDLPPASK